MSKQHTHETCQQHVPAPAHASCGVHDHTAHSHTHAEIDLDCGCGHEHHHHHEQGGKKNVWPIVSLVIAAVLMAAGFILRLFDGLPEFVSDIVFVAAAVLAGYPVLIDGVKDLLKLRLDEHLLVSIAVIAACIIGEFPEAAAVTIFFQVGEMFEEFAVNRSKKSIAALTEIRPDTAHVMEKGTLVQKRAEEIPIGSVITVLPFERVPLDGTVRTGQSSLDASAITGESIPLEASAGTNALSGMINGSGTLELEVTNTYGDSAASRIIDMVENAASRKASAERTVSKFARIYTPVIVVAAILLAVIPSLITGEWSEWIHRSLIFLVASCPCALVLSVPLSFFAGIGAASKKGILVKGGEFIEKLSKADTVVFDKTGTLTTGELSVSSVIPSHGHTEEEVLQYAAGCEYYSNHPIAKAIVTAYGRMEEASVSDFQETPGHGTAARVLGKEVLCGGKAMMEQNQLDCSALPAAQVYVCVAGELIGAVQVSGTVRADSAQAVRELKQLGVNHVVMLTGDNEQAAAQTAQACGITEYRAGLLPGDKVTALEELKKGSAGTVFVGDGINDAPVLATADVGVAMGLGTDAAIEAGDIVLTNNRPSRLSDAVRLFRRTMGIVKFNIAFALIVKMAVLLLGALGLASMWAAVFADVGVSVLAVLNASRILRVRRETTQQLKS